MTTTYTISELAKEFDITPRAIRFYEDQGLITPRREGSRRVYGPRDRTRLKLTLRGKRLGFSLNEVREMIDMYDSPQDTLAQLQHFMGKLAEQRELLERQREDLEITLAEIDNFEQQCKRLLVEHDASAAKAGKAAGGAKPGKADGAAKGSKAAKATKVTQGPAATAKPARAG